MIYFDTVRFVADSMEEMHDFALKLGVPKRYFTNHPHLPHYLHDGGPNKPNFSGKLYRMASKWKRKPKKAKDGQRAVAGIPKIPTAKLVTNSELLSRSHAILTRA